MNNDELRTPASIMQMGNAANLIRQAFQELNTYDVAIVEGAEQVMDQLHAVADWLENPDILPTAHEHDNDDPVLWFINEFRGNMPWCLMHTVEYQFRNGYCYHFAKMLEAMFPGGEVCFAAPMSHIVYKYKGHSYDCEGRDMSGHDFLIPVRWLNDNGFGDITAGYTHTLQDNDSIYLHKPRICTAVNAYLTATGNPDNIPTPYTCDMTNGALNDIPWCYEDIRGSVRFWYDGEPSKNGPCATCAIQLREGWETGGSVEACITEWSVPNENDRMERLGSAALCQTIQYLYEIYGCPDLLTLEYNGDESWFPAWLKATASAEPISEAQDRTVFKLNMGTLMLNLGVCLF